MRFGQISLRTAEAQRLHIGALLDLDPPTKACPRRRGFTSETGLPASQECGRAEKSWSSRPAFAAEDVARAATAATSGLCQHHQRIRQHHRERPGTVQAGRHRQPAKMGNPRAAAAQPACECGQDPGGLEVGRREALVSTFGLGDPGAGEQDAQTVEPC